MSRTGLACVISYLLPGLTMSLLDCSVLSLKLGPMMILMIFLSPFSMFPSSPLASCGSVSLSYRSSGLITVL